MSDIGSAIHGKKILITRAASQAEATASEIEKRGGEPCFLPCMELQCLPQSIQQAIDRPENSRADILFTSRNGVECVVRALGERFGELLSGRRVTAVGDKTARALQQAGITASMIADEASQKGLIKVYRQQGVPQQLLFFRAEEGSDELGQTLISEGCRVVTVSAYRMICPQSDVSDTVRQLQNRDIDAVLLGSARTARNYLQRIGDLDIANTPAVAVISPNVAAAAEALGLNVQAVAKSASFDAMLDALNDYFQHNGA